MDGTYESDLAFSFAGEQRDYVERRHGSVTAAGRAVTLTSCQVVGSVPSASVVRALDWPPTPFQFA
jgi:hypothetical protein